MDEGVFVEWLKRDGEQVQPGNPLFVLESEKATENIEALDGGILRLLPNGPQPGDKVKVGQVLAYLVGKGETIPTSSGESPRRREFTPFADPKEQNEFRATAAASPGRPTISPRARRTARDLGIDWSKLRGTGRNGRIRERDVRTAATTSLSGRLIPHTHIRKIIATRMVAGVTQAAPVTLMTKADATNLVALRNQLQGDVRPGYTDFILKLTAAALRQHPLLQGQWRDDGLFVPETIDIAVAVDTEAGLLAPVVRSVDRLSVREIASQSRELQSQARSNHLTADQMRGATFTVTNLGMFGVDAFTPIIHLPQCAVLGVGRIVREPAVVDEQVVPRDLMTLSLTFDHRVVDGAPAARFLDTVRRNVEHPPPWCRE
jgi:pyruvate dehydrogenase E2 component (dihydrolipoamide acetyltransferase)